MNDTSRIDQWLELYRTAWKTGDSDEISRLFSGNARYFTAPYRDPIEGTDEIVAWWIGQNESDIPWTFEHEVIARQGNLYVVRGVTSYPEGGGTAEDPGPEVYHNLWLITLGEDGRASEFVEYWMLVG